MRKAAFQIQGDGERIAEPLQCLRERLGERVARHIPVSRIGEQGPPESGPLLPIEPFQVLVGAHAEILFHSSIGRESDPMSYGTGLPGRRSDAPRSRVAGELVSIDALVCRVGAGGAVCRGRAGVQPSRIRAPMARAITRPFIEAV